MAVVRDATLAGALVVRQAGTLTSAPPRAERNEIAVEVRGIRKLYGDVVANDAISLTIRRGEIQAVLGENGAGKTTLMNVIAGMVQPDAGEIRVDGTPVVLTRPRDALRHGIGTVYQHFTLVPNLSIVENIVLGTEGGILLDLATAQRTLDDLLPGLTLPAAPATLARNLSMGQRQRVEIIKVLYRGSRVLLLDEPTSVLTPAEVERLFRILLRLKDEGIAVVLITHKLDEAMTVSDRISVLRAGRKIAELGPDELAGADSPATQRRVVALMFGGEPTEPVAALPRTTIVDERTDTPHLLSVQRVTARGSHGAPVLRDLSLDLRAGEIFGLAGVDGNGQKELGEVVAGQRRTTHGRVFVGIREITNHGVAVAVAAGVGYVTDDRLGEGCVAAGSIADNLILKCLDRRPFSRRGVLHRQAIDRNAQRLIAAFDVRAPGPATRIGRLSGGNIQKVLLARELARNPKVLVCNNPTSGLDWKTTRFVLQTLREHADNGNAVLLISSELDEILEVSDRVGVIATGQMVATFPRRELDAEEIGRLMLGGRP